MGLQSRLSSVSGQPYRSVWLAVLLPLFSSWTARAFTCSLILGLSARAARRLDCVLTLRIAEAMQIRSAEDQSVLCSAVGLQLAWTLLSRPL